METAINKTIFEGWGLDCTRPLVIAGPCSAETEEQVMDTARRLKNTSTQIYRAGIWKPRTRPNSFEGVGVKGLKWLKQVFNASMDDLGFALYIHENNQYRLNEVKKYWADKLEIDFSCFKKVYFKKHKPKTNRKNIKESYYGLVEVKVYKSSKLLRRIEGWIEGLRGKYCRVV